MPLIFVLKSHEPFHSFQLTGLAQLAFSLNLMGHLAGNSERAHGISKKKINGIIFTLILMSKLVSNVGNAFLLLVVFHDTINFLISLGKIGLCKGFGPSVAYLAVTRFT
jgi:hypothetical protein